MNDPQSHPVPGNSTLSNSCVIGLCIILLLTCSILVLHGQWNIDEGFYLFCTKLLAAGNMPYADFGFTQPPLVLILKYPILEIVGYSLLGIRIATAIFLWFGISLVAILLASNGKKSEAIVFLILLLLSVGWLVTAMKARNYGLASVFLVFSTYISLLDLNRSVLKWCLFVLFATFSVLTRYPSVFLLLPMSFVVLSELKGWKLRVACSAGAVFMAIIVFLSSSFGDLKSFWFWTVEYHLLSEVDTSRKVQFMEFFRLSMFAYGAFLWALIFAFKRRMRKLSVVGSIQLIVLIVNLISSRVYGEYSSIYIPSIMLYSSKVLTPILKNWPIRINLMILSCVGLGSLLLFKYTTVYTAVSYGMIGRALEATAVLKRNIPEGGIVIAAPLEIAVDAGAKIPRSLSMGVFSVSNTLSSEEIQRYRLNSYGSLLAMMKDPRVEALVLYTDARGNFMWSVPTINPFPTSYFDEFSSVLHGYYDILYSNEDYVVLLRKNRTKI